MNNNGLLFTCVAAFMSRYKLYRLEYCCFYKLLFNNLLLSKSYIIAKLSIVICIFDIVYTWNWGLVICHHFFMLSDVKLYQIKSIIVTQFGFESTITFSGLPTRLKSTASSYSSTFSNYINEETSISSKLHDKVCFICSSFY